MNRRVLVLVAFFALLFSYAQNPLAKGQFQLNAGTGFSEWGIPVYVGLEYGIHKDVSIGVETSFRRYYDEYYFANDKHKYTHTGFAIGTFGNYHFNSLLKIPKKFDFYAGANITYFSWQNDYKYYGNDNGLGNDYWKNYYGYEAKSAVELGIQVGGRYFFTKSFGLNAEVGTGAVTGLKAGITYKF